MSVNPTRITTEDTQSNWASLLRNDNILLFLYNETIGEYRCAWQDRGWVS